MTNKQTIDDFLTQSYKMASDYEKIQDLMEIIYSQMQEKKKLTQKNFYYNLLKYQDQCFILKEISLKFMQMIVSKLKCSIRLTIKNKLYHQVKPS